MPNGAKTSDSPNILLILNDDMGFSDIGCYGGEIQTPNLDRLAANGLRYSQFYNTARCSPSRASLLTGRVPSQHGVHDWLSGGNGCGQRAINFTDGEVFYTDRLAAHGFGALGLSGKYHLGNSPVARHGFNWWRFVHQSGGGSYTDPPIVVNGSCISARADPWTCPCSCHLMIAHLPD